MMPDKRYLIITPKDIGLAVIHPDRDVAVHLDLDQEQTGFLSIEVMIRMTPTEARNIAQALVRKADEAEAGVPRA